MIKDIEWRVFCKYWRYNIKPDGYVDIRCKTAADGEASEFTVKRGIYNEFKALISTIESLGLKGWISWTWVKNAHVMKMHRKFGAQPYHLDEEDRMFFIRRF
jgi:hypothetical protein